ncbi:aspartate/glutamate racemase family protein [Streptomyces sp. NPDC050560]|uniref:aspartate/glutamate racemase family protein n=1 Tax=Streptomyces sp. NPDC050560 TaxID=3365630 RepID=UPI0037A4649D
MTTTGGADGVLGILGGMGPLASTGFLNTLYEVAAERTGPFAEQDLPRFLIDSDPGFPDRTEAILAGREEEFARRLRLRLDGLVGLGATRVVVTCVTAHHFLARLPAATRARLVSLVDLALDDLATAGGDERLLLVATLGTRNARIFERAGRWPEVADRVVLPGPGRQRELHELIYRLKREPATDALLSRLLRAVEEEGCTGFVVGCTEIHLLTRRLRARGGAVRAVDPLCTLAAQLKTLLAE